MNVITSTIHIDGKQYRIEEIPNHQSGITQNDNIVILEDFIEEGKVIFKKEKLYKPFNVFSVDGRLTIVVRSELSQNKTFIIGRCSWKKVVKI